MDNNNYVEVWKLKKIAQKLRDARGSGTSMISMWVPPGGQVCQLNRMLTEEYGTATNIKSRVNRLSVLDAITSTQQRLKRYSKIPPNGLLLFCGTILTEDGKEKRVTIDLEPPFKPVGSTLYMCDSRFHVDIFKDLIDQEDAYGFIIMDGCGCLYGTIQGSTRRVLQQFSVELPKKHGRGGQSSVRFARLRMEARHNYVRKVAENAVGNFITNDRCNVRGIVLAGSADFKTELSRSDLFDPRLNTAVIAIIDIAYGGMAGFNQAIHLTSEAMGNVRFTQERRLICQFMTEIQMDSGKICYTIPDTIKALEMGAVEKLIVWEQLPTECRIVRHKTTGEETGWFDTVDPDPTVYATEPSIPFVEWIANHYTRYGAVLEFITDCSAEGTQFVKGFSGVGGLLRWKVDFETLEEPDEEAMTATADREEEDMYW
jgi:peptide chain release factor subunit 1